MLRLFKNEFNVAELHQDCGESSTVQLIVWVILFCRPRRHRKQRKDFFFDAKTVFGSVLLDLLDTNEIPYKFSKYSVD